MATEFLKFLVIIFGISAIVVYLLSRLRVPAIVGFLAAGVILGPYGLELIRDVKDVEVLAEIGVILLMFTIGLELSLKSLMMFKASVFIGGSLQMIFTTAIVTFVCFVVFEMGMNVSVFNGLLVSLSSTAIVMKTLLDRAELNTPYGRTSVGVLIFQDLCVVPVMLFLPVLAGEGSGLWNVIRPLLTSLLVLGIVIAAARWIVPMVLHQVVSTRSRELFVIVIILLCLGTALFTSALGLSLALGAFLAGLIISESEYASQAISDILPFKESFTGLFFISIGMLMNLDYLRMHYDGVLLVVLAIFLIKIIAATLSSYLLGQSLRTSLQTGFYLSQIGEFSFILVVAGKSYGLITDSLYQIFLASAVFTMILTPFLIKVSASASTWVISKTPVRRFERAYRRLEKMGFPKKRSEHVVILGFGTNGKNLAAVLKTSGIPYVVLEMNNSTVIQMKKKGEPIFYGDGTSVEILNKLSIQNARMLVVAISDAAATRRIVQIARKESPDLHIIVRTRYLAEVEDLKGLGATEVIPEEFETSVEIFSRVLHHYHIPRNIIAEHIDITRKDNYRALRTVDLPKKHLAERYELLRDIETETYMLQETFYVGGSTLKELQIRSHTGVTIITIQRNGEIFQNPPPDFILEAGDVVLMIGKKAEIERAIEYLESDELLSRKY